MKNTINKKNFGYIIAIFLRVLSYVDTFEGAYCLLCRFSWWLRMMFLP